MSTLMSGVTNEKLASDGATLLCRPQGLRPEIARIIEALARAAAHRENRDAIGAATFREGETR
jgi:hypothetical protein